MSRGLINSGFEVVASLPTTDLFEGRQVLYQNRVWVYSNGWRSPNNPVSFPTGVTLQSSTEALTAAAKYVELSNFQLEQIPELLNKSLFISNNDNCVKKSDRLYELIDNETGTITVKSGIVNPVLGQTLRYTAINPSYGLSGLESRVNRNGNTPYAVYCVYIPQLFRNEKAIYKIEYYIYTDATGDGDVNNQDNYVWKTVFEKELRQYTELIYPIAAVPNHPNSSNYSYIFNIRVSITPTTKDHEYNIDIKDLDIKYFGLNHQSLIYANRLMNYDAVIEPTQTGEEFKPIPWILQYLVQGVNWLKANKFSGSYDDLTNTPNLATVATSGSYNDLTDKPKLYEANLLWGGRNISNGYSPVDGAMMSELSANVMAFPNPAGISIEYSRDGGVTWIDYEATDAQKVDVFTSSTNLYCGKSAPDGLLATVGYQLRITITPVVCRLYTRLNKIITEVSTDEGGNCWATFKGLKSKEVAAGNEDDAYYDTFVNKASINGWSGYNVVNFSNIQTSESLTDPIHANLYYRLRLIFGYDIAYPSSRAGLKVKKLRFFGDGRWTLPSNLAMYNHLYTYDWKQNVLFPAKVESKEIINFDVNNIEPTQTGSAVTKTSTWLWQYLVQGINWLKANKFSGSYNDLTNTPNLATVATSGSYNDLTNTPTIPSSFSDLSGTISSAQIPNGSITNDKLANSWINVNGRTVYLADTVTLPCFISFGGTLYQARIENNWLQIYRHGGWANAFYLLTYRPTECRYITDLSDPSWFDESVSEYELDNSATEQLLRANNPVNLADLLKDIDAQQITFNSSVIPSKQFNKGALDNIISNLKGNGYSVFVENDIDTILSSGNDWFMSIKIKKVGNPYKAIIECYVAK